ncbi:hypothetical protein QWI30_00300 [Citrobacter freundii]|nr:hypothetical protein [Citrobacter freundii]
MNTLAALENTFRDMRKHGCQTVMVTQSLADFGRYSYKPRPAFQDWIERLKTGERLPRGRYFVGKKPGGRLVLIDELGGNMDRKSNSDSYQRWMIEKADKRERTQISMSFVKMKDVLFNVLAIGTVLAALVVIFYEVQSSL